ncbi:MAG: spore coat associated protein CotJA [Clostridia bacterium]|nr:spore coat associated protein CotJA [Clostridia bacterium]
MNGCYENDEATLHDRPLAYAYVPIQRWRMLFPEGEALSHGTLFEELYKPMEVYGNE